MLLLTLKKHRFRVLTLWTNNFRKSGRNGGRKIMRLTRLSAVVSNIPRRQCKHFCNLLANKQSGRLLLSVCVFSVKVLLCDGCVPDPGPATVEALHFVSVLHV